MWIELPIKQLDGELEKIGVETEGQDSIYLLRPASIISAMPDKCKTTDEDVTTIAVAGEGLITVYMPLDKFMKFLIHAEYMSRKAGGIYTITDWEARDPEEEPKIEYSYEYPKI